MAIWIVAAEIIVCGDSETEPTKDTMRAWIKSELDESSLILHDVPVSCVEAKRLADVPRAWHGSIPWGDDLTDKQQTVAMRMRDEKRTSLTRRGVKHADRH